MRLLFLIVPLAALSLTGCDILGEDDGPDYEKVVDSSENLSFKTLLFSNDSDDFDDILRMALAVVYDEEDEPYNSLDSSSLQEVNITLNGRRLGPAIWGLFGTGTDSAFQLIPGREYAFRIEAPEGEAVTAITAPTVSQIEFVNLPETHRQDQPLTVEWTYPAGELNDGGIIVSIGRSYNSGILPPRTRSHTIPAEAFRYSSSSRQIAVQSVRYALFPRMRDTQDRNISVVEGLDHRGSFFAISVGIDRYVEIAEPDK